MEGVRAGSEVALSSDSTRSIRLVGDIHCRQLLGQAHVAEEDVVQPGIHGLQSSCELQRQTHPDGLHQLARYGRSRTREYL